MVRQSAAALLGLGLWPGCARWAENGQGGAFRFAVLNDTHYQSPKCPGWFERVRASILAQRPRPELCLLAGDLSEHGTQKELGAMKDVLRSLGMDCHAVIGNHDFVSGDDRSAWDELYPKSLNYHFQHRGWQFIGLDSTQGREWRETRISSATLNWCDSHLPKLNPALPTVVFSHFPFGENVATRPANAEALLQRFLRFNLVAVYNGHFHGFTERRAGATRLTTNWCCAISRSNHDGIPGKGYFLCDARDGKIERRFVEVMPA